MHSYILNFMQMLKDVMLLQFSVKHISVAVEFIDQQTIGDSKKLQVESAIKTI